MKIFIHAHYYLPRTFAGAEKFLHEIALSLSKGGHDIIVSIDEDAEYDYQGIHVVSNKRNIQQWYVWADAIITHLLNAETAIFLAGQFGKPLYHLLHNNRPAQLLFDSPKNNFIIYNSNALKNELAINLPSIVVHPPIDTAYWQNDKDHYFNEYITLVNCCHEKGGMILQQLAEIMPAYKFMGIKGSYNPQIIQNSPHRNIQFMPVQQDMKPIYNVTRLLIMPSSYESWGMVASEAMASGIPVICTNTPGLYENCGDAGYYVERTAADFRRAIEALNDKNLYDKMAKKGKQRNQENELDKIARFMNTNEGWEKVDFSDFKEKVESGPSEGSGREKQEIKKPGRGRPKKKAEWITLS